MPSRVLLDRVRLTGSRHSRLKGDRDVVSLFAGVVLVRAPGTLKELVDECGHFLVGMADRRGWQLGVEFGVIPAAAGLARQNGPLTHGCSAHGYWLAALPIVELDYSLRQKGPSLDLASQDPDFSFPKSGAGRYVLLKCELCVSQGLLCLASVGQRGPDICSLVSVFDG